MEDFELLESLIENTDSSNLSLCEHTDREFQNEMYICRICGFTERVNDGQTYSSHKMYKRATKTNSITQSLEQKGFDSKIIVIANKIYSIVVDENSKRTGNRSSIICACVFQ